jgi:hypothetical protein
MLDIKCSGMVMSLVEGGMEFEPADALPFKPEGTPLET